MAGYIRQSSFVDGDTITAALFNNEYNQLLNAFNNATGHSHDGTTAEGPVIGLIGDAGETAPNNKVLIDTTNNFVEFYVQVASAPVQQLYIADGAIIPVTDSDIDLGTSSLYFKNAYIDSITTTGNIDVGGNLTVTGTTTFNGGTITMGDAATDNVVFGADIDSNIIPDDDNTYDLGSTSQEWRNLYIDGTANIDSLVADTADINGGTIDGSIIGGTTAAAITGTAITGTSFVIGSADISEAELETIDGVTAGTVAASKAIVVDANKDITGGRNITITGEIDAATLDISGNADIDGTLEADAITINGVTLSETIADTVGAMVSSNTETGIAVSYDDADNTLDFVIGADAIVQSMIADDAIDSQHYVDGSIDLVHMSINSIDSDQYVDGSIDLVHMSANSVDSDQYVDGSIDLIHMSANSVDSDQYVDGSIDTVHLADDAVTGAKLADNIDIAGTLDVTGILTADSNVVVAGNLTVNGTTTTLNTATLDVEDKNITINYGAGDTSASANGAGITIQDAIDASNDATILWDTTNDEFDFSHAINVAGKVTSTGTSVFASLDISGDIDVDGTTNLDVVDIDGAVDMASTLTVAGDANFDSGTLFVDVSANAVGIGTSSPAHSLDVVKAGSNIIRVQNSASSADASFYATNTVGTGIFGMNATGQYMYGLGNFPLLFYANAAERLRIDSSGNVGIGTSSPATNLHIQSTSEPAITLFHTAVQAAQIGLDSSGSLTFGIDGSTGATERMKINTSGDVGIGISSPTEKFDVNGGTIIRGALTNGASSGNGLRFEHTSDIGQIYSLDPSVAWRELRLNASQQTFYIAGGEKMRLDSSGNLLVGVSASSGTPANGATIVNTADASAVCIGHANGTDGGNSYVNFAYNAGLIGSITQSGTTAVLYNTSSDGRLKNITGSARGLEVINELNPVSYNWKADGTS
jgi:cytoskeletal protein CcmA (bactofilin family)